MLFQASLIDPTNPTLPDILGRDGVITSYDHSNYDTNDQVGHALSDFSEYKRVVLTMPTGVDYVQATSLVLVKDELIAPPSVEEFGITLEYDGDQVYELSVEALPTWNSAAAYLVVDAPQVYYLGVFYEAIANTTNDNPVSSPTKWKVITELSSRYKVSVKWSITYDTEVKWIENVRLTAQQLNLDDLKLTTVNPYYRKASRLNLILNAVGIQTGARNWAACMAMIEYAKTL